MSASDHLANELVDHLLGAAYTAPSIYVSLHSGDPGTTGANELSTAVGDYDRKLHSSWNAASSGDATNNGATTFTQATADWATATYFGAWDALTAGNFLAGGQLTTAKTVKNGDTAEFATQAITVSTS